MGADDSAPAEAPVHRVDVSAFMIDRFEVTNQEFAAFVEALDYVTDAERHGWGWHWTGRWHRLAKANWRAPQGPGSSILGRADHPVVQVSWHDARAYCHWRGKRLPTEAEWERAARGPGNRRYAWGDAPPREAGVFRASYGSDHCCAADTADGFLSTAPGGSFPEGRSTEGVDDLTGNVWEWVEDGYDPGFYARSPASNPLNHDPTLMKVIRGGGWGNAPEGLRATLRHANPPHYGLSMVGIRCAK
jgi:formylglycine-generating enzyme required for sulfatase activity